MARIPNTPPLRSVLAKGSGRLKKDKPMSRDEALELAGALDRALAPGGWAFLQHTDPVRAAGANAALAIDVLKTIHEQIIAAVDADPEAPSVTAKVNEGFNRFLSGEFVPDAKRADTLAVKGQQRSMLNVSPLGELTRMVAERGWKPARVASHYLMSCYGLGPYAPDAQKFLSRGQQRVPEVPRVVRDAIRAEATRTGWRTDDVVNEGLQKFLDGEFEPQAPVWTSEAKADLVQMKLYPNDDLFERVTKLAKARGIRPLQVAIDYLLDEFEITDGVAGSTE